MPRIHKSAIVLPLLLALTLTGCSTAGAVSALDAAKQAGAAKSAEPAVKVGTHGNPAPVGTTIAVSDISGDPAFNVTVGAAVLEDNAEVAAGNMFNDAPTAGNQWAVFPVTYTYVGKSTGTPGTDVAIDFVAADGKTYKSYDHLAVIDGGVGDLHEMYPGATGAGKLVIMIPSADAAKGLLAVGSLFGQDKFFIKVS